MVDMSVKIGNVTLKNPIMPASGCFSTDLAQVIDLNRLGALVAKTVSREFRAGKAHGIPGQVAMEQVMACGLGPCYVCVRTFEVNGKKELRRVCIEGPVFDLQEAVGW